MGNMSENLHYTDECIAIFAGRGDLPLQIARTLEEQGIKPFLIGVRGNLNPDIEDFESVILNWGQMGRMFKILHERNIKTTVFAGGVTRPAKLKEFKFDWGGICALPKVAGLMLKGDNTLLSGLAGIFESRGVRIIGAHTIVPSLLAEAGNISGATPNKKQRESIKIAFQACKRLGAADIGQAAIAEEGTVIAEEDRWGY